MMSNEMKPVVIDKKAACDRMKLSGPDEIRAGTAIVALLKIRGEPMAWSEIFPVMLTSGHTKAAAATALSLLTGGLCDRMVCLDDVAEREYRPGHDDVRAGTAANPTVKDSLTVRPLSPGEMDIYAAAFVTELNRRMHRVEAVTPFNTEGWREKRTGAAQLALLHAHDVVGSSDRLYATST